MDSYTQFFVDKTTHTFADALAAFGLARIIADLLEAQAGDAGYDITLRDDGAYYRLICDPPLLRATAESRTAPLIPIQALATAKNKDKLPPGIPAYSYEEEREKVNQYFDARKAKVPDAEITVRPHPHWDIFRALNPGALPGYIGLVTQWWQAQAAIGDVLALILDLFSATPNAVPVAEDAWKQLDKAHGWGIKPLVTCQQLYNPDQGKGQNKTRADGISIGNQQDFWLLEYLKAVGFYQAAMTRLVRGAKDRKTFVVAPREISYALSEEVMSDFTALMQFSETSTRFDILAALRYVKALLEHLPKAPDIFDEVFSRRGVNLKQDLVAGFYTAFYKDLGNAVATMNISFIALPGWVTVSNPEDVTPYTEILEQLELLVRQFDESNSDAFTLLQHLRDFVSGDDLAAFFRFTNAFPAYYMGMKERGQYAYPVYTAFIERLVMSTEKKLIPILESEGFRNIAKAIRQSTVTAQYRKSQGDRKYDVRYGLGQDLARKARYPDAFIAALADFMHKYNAENAQVMETRPGPYRPSIRTSDIDEITRLIDEYGSETVANLLIAYGYARLPRLENDEETQNQETQA